MRFFDINLIASLTAAALLTVATPVTVTAQSNGSEAVQDAKTEAPPSRGDKLDDYFSQLKREYQPAPAKRIADSIWAEWRQSGSATGDQLMAWANEAMRDERHHMALDLLDQVIILLPEYAEGWNRRATLHYMMDNHSKSMADISRVLQLEPRHFGALMGMGSILSQAGRDEAALNAYLKVLEVYPAMREAQDRVATLSDDLAGDEI